MKDFKTILNSYNFTDEHGHRLEFCQDFIDLLEVAGREKWMKDRAAAATGTQNPRPPERICLHITGGTLPNAVYARINGVNDQFFPGETYNFVLPGERGAVKVVRAKCTDWFQVGGPEWTVFTFERL